MVSNPGCGVCDADIIADYHRSQGVGRAALGEGRIERDLAIDYTRFHGGAVQVECSCPI